MLCFVDESGDTGLKIGKGSSKFFVVTIVLFRDDDDALSCDQRIGLLRKELGLSKDFEFHFNETPEKIKEEFFRAIAPYNYFYLAIIINKSALFGEGFKFKYSFYKYICSLVFENAKSHLDDAVVIFDGSGSRAFKNELQSYLKNKINQKNSFYIKKVKIQDSKKNNLLQLADMICGAVTRSYKTKRKNHQNFRKFIYHRELGCQIWPLNLDEEKKKQYLSKKKKK